MGGNAGETPVVGGAVPGTPSPTSGTPPSDPPPSLGDWRSALVGEHAPLAKEKSLEIFKGKDINEVFPSIIKSYVHNAKLVGSSVQIPPPDATPEALAAFRSKIGVPKDTSGYADVKITEIEGLGPVDMTRIDAMAKPAFLKIGLTPRQAQDIMNLYGEVITSQRREMADAMVKNQQELEGEWGLNFDANVSLAQRALRKYAPEPFLKLLADSQLDMHPDMIRAFYNIGKQIAEDGLIDGVGPSALTGPDIDKQITELRAEQMTVIEGTQRAKDIALALEKLYRTRYGTGTTGPQMERPR